MSQHPTPDINAAPNFDINNLPSLPSLNDEEIAAIQDDLKTRLMKKLQKTVSQSGRGADAKVA
jgi:hypothetical protein